jgi:type IV secretion system protein VirD4
MAEDTRSLQTVRELASNPERLQMFQKLACESKAWGGMLARRGGFLSHCAEKERGSVLTTLDRHLRGFDSLAVAESTRRSTFDPRDLRAGKLTVYLILPPEHMRAQTALLRMWISALLRAVIMDGLKNPKPVHYILDEMSSVGQMECLMDAVVLYRAFNVRCQFYVQDAAQLKLCFPNGQDATLLNNATHVHFAVNSYEAAEAVSARIGECTVIVESGGSTRGSSSSWSFGGQPQRGGGTSDSYSSNWSQMARRLAKPEEILKEPKDTAFVFAPGVPPTRTKLLRYYQEKWLLRPPGFIRRSISACCVLTSSLVLLLATTAFALWLTVAVRDEPWAQQATTPQVRQWLDFLASFQPDDRRFWPLNVGEEP